MVPRVIPYLVDYRSPPVASVFESMGLRNCVLDLIVADVHFLAGLSDLTVFGERWAVGAFLTLAFTGLARWLRGVTNAGALAGAISCFVLYLGGGPGAFAALITVFGLAWITTRLGLPAQAEVRHRRKARGPQRIAGIGKSGRGHRLRRALSSP